MSNKHLTAAFRCSRFKGTTRLVLLYLADQVYDSPAKLFGTVKRKRASIMTGVNCKRHQTVSKAIAELIAAGAIRQFRKQYSAATYFVNIKWLEEHPYTDVELAEFSPEEDTPEVTTTYNYLSEEAG